MDRVGALSLVLLVAAGGAALAGCCTTPAATEVVAAVPGKVTDVAAFDAFIGTRPTPAQFRARYPDVVLVLPGEIATKEMRLDRSRYFADLDADGRIRGGRFQ